MTATDAEMAIDALVDDVALIAASPEHNVVEADQAPCSPDEAKALVTKAVEAANTFYDAVAELLSRDAYKALGHSSPREMIIREFSGTLINPSTGKPYSDVHIRRMARAAWLGWTIATMAGVDMSEVHINERALRDIASANPGIRDGDIVDEIGARINELGDAGPDEVKDVVDSVLGEWSGRAEDDSDSQDDDDKRPYAPDGDFDSIQGEGTGGSARPPGQKRGKNVEDDDDDGDAESSGGRRTGGSASAAFDEELPPAVDLIADMDINGALESLRKASDVRRIVAEIIEIGNRLPTLTEVQAKVPAIIDAIDDAELNQTRDDLARCKQFVELSEKAKKVIDAAVDDVDVRIDEAI